MKAWVPIVITTVSCIGSTDLEKSGEPVGLPGNPPAVVAPPKDTGTPAPPAETPPATEPAPSGDSPQGTEQPQGVLNQPDLAEVIAEVGVSMADHELIANPPPPGWEDSTLRDAPGHRGTVGGAAPTAPISKVTLSPLADITGTVDADAVKRQHRRFLGQVRYCYELVLEDNPELQGTLQVAVTTDATGRVTHITPGGNTTGSQRLSDCVVAKVKRWRYPNSVHGTFVQRYAFEPAR